MAGTTTAPSRNAYAVAVCPTIVFARRGGRVLESLVGVQDAATLAGARWRRLRMSDPDVHEGYVAAELRGASSRACGWCGCAVAGGVRAVAAGAARAAARCSPTGCAARRRSRCARGRVPHAYRVFFRHIGLDPDVAPVAGSRRSSIERLLHGGFRRAARCRGRARDRVHRDRGRRCGRSTRTRLAPPLECGPARSGGWRWPTRDGAVAALFATPRAAACAARASTARLALVDASSVPGVAALFAEEALWIAGEA